MFAILRYSEFKCRRDTTFLISYFKMALMKNKNNVVINS